MKNNCLYRKLPDETLFALIKENDQEAFGEIYSRYWNYLTSSAAKHLQNWQKAEDMVQEILISLYNRRHTLEFSVSIRAYLSQALKFKIMNEFRSKSVRDTYQKTIHYTCAGSAQTNVYHVCESKELASNINRSIDSLPEKCREVFMLSRSEDLSYKDISGHLGISVSTVEKHISKALKVLRTSLEFQGFSIN